MVVFLVGKNGYEISAIADIKSWPDVNDLLPQIIYSFAPGPGVNTDPFPPEPPTTRVILSSSETIYLSDGSTLYQGHITNNDSYWWATNLKVQLTLQDANGAAVWETEISPETISLRPEERTLYEIRVPSDAPSSELSQIGLTWNWSCSEPVSQE